MLDTTIFQNSGYVDDEKRQLIALLMIEQSLKMIINTPIVTNSKHLKDAWVLSFHNMIEHDGGDFQQSESIQAFVEMLRSTGLPVINVIKIITCFENYFKAVLLLKKYVIHEIDRHNDLYEKEFKKLSNKQCKKPMLQSELETNVRSITSTQEPDGGNYRSLAETTLHFNILMRASYQCIYELPNTLYDLLWEFNTQRNTLHLLLQQKISISDRTFEEFIFIGNIVNDYIWPRYESLYHDVEKIFVLPIRGLDHIERV
jgi:hypothetical protein